MFWCLLGGWTTRGSRRVLSRIPSSPVSSKRLDWTLLHNTLQELLLSREHLVCEMVVHNLYLFDRHGTLLFYHEWLRRKHTSMSKVISLFIFWPSLDWFRFFQTDQEEEAKLLYGMLFSMKSFVAKLSPHDMKQGFLSYVTSAYR